MTDPLLEPLNIGTLRVRNRVFSSAHAPSGYLENGRPGSRYARYHEEKAKGGVGLTIIGGSSSVAPDSADVFGNFSVADDGVIPFLEDIANRVHRHGSAVMVQITHLGRRSKDNIGSWLPTVAPSPIRERAHRSFPKEMEAFDFPRVIDAYAAAAVRAQRGGLDGVEVAALAGHLIDQFWSPRSNNRTDEYGGSLQARMRFATRVLEAVRQAVGPDFVVGLRMSVDEGVAQGLHEDEGIEVARAISATGLIDFIDVVFGAGFSDRELADIIPPFGRPAGQHIELAGRVRSRVDIPVLHAGRIPDLATARHALASGSVDMVGMTRAHIADPHVVLKLQRGEEDRIRPCVGASVCLSGTEMVCIHNPATGREKLIPHVVPQAPQRRRVVVVGGGPAGLEAARVSAERGHETILLEAADRLGGQLAVLSRLGRHSEKHAIIGWLASEAARLEVDVRTKRFVEAGDILGLAPDVVIVATGGLPLTTVNGVEDVVVSTGEALGRPARPGTRTLVYDEHGGEQALVAAEYLACAGEAVELVTPDRMIGLDVGSTVYPDYMSALYEAGASFTPHHEVSQVERHDGQIRVMLRNVFTGAESSRTTDQVIVELGTIPVADVYDDLKSRSTNGGQTDLEAFIAGKRQTLITNESGEFQLFRVGDAVSHRGVHAAMLDSRRLCMTL